MDSDHRPLVPETSVLPTQLLPNMAASAGLEPTLLVPKTSVRPLDDKAMVLIQRIELCGCVSMGALQAPPSP